MNDIINRLRDAAGAAGETIEDVPPLRLSARRTHRAWLVPVAAAASVVVAVGAGVAVNRAGGDAPGDTSPIVAGAVAPPKFFAQVTGAEIVIRAVDGGAETARIPSPAQGERFAHVQAAQDNRVFYATTEGKNCTARFHRFTLDDNGKASSLEALPYAPPDNTMPISLAVSGDGAKLAYGLQSCDPGGAAWRIVMTDTATGESRSWYGDVPTHGLSMSADGRYIAYRMLWVMTVNERGEERRILVLPSGSPAIGPSGESGVVEVVPAESAEPDPVPTKSAAPVVSPTKSAAPVVSPTGGGETAVRTDPDPARSAVLDPPSGEPAVSPGAGREPSPPRASVPGSAAPSSGMPPVEGPAAGAEQALPGGEATLIATPVPEATMTVTVTPSRDGRLGTRSVPLVGSQDVYVLDTSAAGDDLARSRKITLGEPVQGVSIGGLHGVAISPDGGSLYAAFMPAVTVASEADGAEMTVGPMPIVEYGLDGKAGKVIYRGDEGGMALLDSDGSGQRFLVRKGLEFGAVDAGGYRTLITVREGDGYTTIVW